MGGNVPATLLLLYNIIALVLMASDVVARCPRLLLTWYAVCLRSHFWPSGGQVRARGLARGLARAGQG